MNPSKGEKKGNIFIVTDCGSTTTKAILIEKKKGVYRQTFRSEAPTTVEAPVEDITVGLKRALLDLSILSGRALLNDAGEIIHPAHKAQGCDFYISTSSAGGGLQMVALGLVRNISAASALKAALGAGAIVTDCIACDDQNELFERVDKLRKLRPDMVLLSGGTEGGQVVGVVELAELLALAEPKPRFGATFQLPVVFAGNSHIANEVTNILAKSASVIVEKNVRPTVEEEDLSPARDKIHELFLTHVMQQAPGFGKLIELCDIGVLPTPSAVGKILRLFGKMQNSNVMCVDIGGATTDVFSIVDGHFNRTVSANLGMSYSAAFVLQECGIDNIRRWICEEISAGELLNQIMNKTVRPTTLPQTTIELQVEQAVAREAIRLSFEQHVQFATGLKGTITERNIDSGFVNPQHPLVSAGDFDFIIGSGGVLSHAPSDIETIAMLVDSVLPWGITTIAKDSIFMLPHLGILSEIDQQAALEVFNNDCIERLCTCVSPRGKMKLGAPCISYRFVPLLGEDEIHGVWTWGQLVIEGITESGTLFLNPARKVDVGGGLGKPLSKKITETTHGVLFDGRGRPLSQVQNTAWNTILKERKNG